MDAICDPVPAYFSSYFAGLPLPQPRCALSSAGNLRTFRFRPGYYAAGGPLKTGRPKKPPSLAAMRTSGCEPRALPHSRSLSLSSRQAVSHLAACLLTYSILKAWEPQCSHAGAQTQTQTQTLERSREAEVPRGGEETFLVFLPFCLLFFLLFFRLRQTPFFPLTSFWPLDANTWALGREPLRLYFSKPCWLDGWLAGLLAFYVSMHDNFIGLP